MLSLYVINTFMETFDPTSNQISPEGINSSTPSQQPIEIGSTTDPKKVVLNGIVFHLILTILTIVGFLAFVEKREPFDIGEVIFSAILSAPLAALYFIFWSIKLRQTPIFLMLIAYSIVSFFGLMMLLLFIQDLTK